LFENFELMWSIFIFFIYKRRKRVRDCGTKRKKEIGREIERLLKYCRLSVDRNRFCVAWYHDNPCQSHCSNKKKIVTCLHDSLELIGDVFKNWRGGHKNLFSRKLDERQSEGFSPIKTHNFFRKSIKKIGSKTIVSLTVFGNNKNTNHSSK
jgi:hypothetical protein